MLLYTSGAVRLPVIPLKVAYISQVYYHTSFENYVVHEVVIVSLPPQNGRLVAYCDITSIPFVAEIGQLVNKSRGGT
jgi:hypothetical protein